MGRSRKSRIITWVKVKHSTGVKDGKEGFANFFTDFFKRNPKREIKIVRAFEDGNFVFLHVHQNLSLFLC